jgi:hypothetical protein
MRNLQTRPLQVQGQVNGNRPVSLLDPVYVFKGKLRAAALRGKFHDSADLRWLESHYGNQLRQNKSQFDLQYVGLALRRYPELHNLFDRLGLNIPVAEAGTAQIDLAHLPAPKPGDVHRGLLKIPTREHLPEGRLRVLGQALHIVAPPTVVVEGSTSVAASTSTSSLANPKIRDGLHCLLESISLDHCS